MVVAVAVRVMVGVRDEVAVGVGDRVLVSDGKGVGVDVGAVVLVGVGRVLALPGDGMRSSRQLAPPSGKRPTASPEYEMAYERKSICDPPSASSKRIEARLRGSTSVVVD